MSPGQPRLTLPTSDLSARSDQPGLEQSRRARSFVVAHAVAPSLNLRPDRSHARVGCRRSDHFSGAHAPKGGHSRPRERPTTIIVRTGPTASAEIPSISLSPVSGPPRRIGQQPRPAGRASSSVGDHDAGCHSSIRVLPRGSVSLGVRAVQVRGPPVAIAGHLTLWWCGRAVTPLDINRQRVWPAAHHNVAHVPTRPLAFLGILRPVSTNPRHALLLHVGTSVVQQRGGVGAELRCCSSAR